MKLEPITNPHSKITMETKKTKFMEKEELIEKTKTQSISKYGVSRTELSSVVLIHFRKRLRPLRGWVTEPQTPGKATT